MLGISDKIKNGNLSIVGKAPAKINLHLSVGRKRNDGYHSIISIFQMISLYDILTFRWKGSGGVIFKSNVKKMGEENNLVVRVIRELERIYNVTFDMEVELYKEIPIGAGLGGGSSDAATALLCLRKLVRFVYGIKVKDEVLKDIANSLGSDILFFLGEATALVLGRGDIVQSIAPRGDYQVIIVFPGIPIDTKEAYKWIDEKENGVSDIEEGNGMDYVEMYHGDIPEWQFYNSFTEVLVERYEVLGRIMKELYDLGALYSNISGSGSSVFGIFSDKKNLNNLFSYLKKNYKFVKLCKALERKGECVLKLE